MPGFKYGTTTLTRVERYTYLGVVMASDGSFKEAVQSLHNKALKALFSLSRALGSHNFNIQTSLKLFDSLIKPIVLYNAEVWGMSILNCDKLLQDTESKTKLYDSILPESIQLKFCKYILGVHRLATNNAVRAELGRYPLAVDIMGSAVKYWHFVSSPSHENTLVAECLRVHANNSWLSNINSIFSNLGLTHINRDTPVYHLKKQLKIKLHTLYSSQWTKELWNDTRRNCNQANKLRHYRGFKNSIYLEPYLLLTYSRERRRVFTKLRISAHNLHIEKGRMQNNYKPVNQRVCYCCNDGSVESEVHFILYCKLYQQERTVFIQELTEIYPSLTLWSDIELYNFIMTAKEHDVCNLVTEYIHTAFTKRNNYST